MSSLTELRKFYKISFVTDIPPDIKLYNENMRRDAKQRKLEEWKQRMEAKKAKTPK